MSVTPCVQLYVDMVDAASVANALIIAAWKLYADGKWNKKTQKHYLGLYHAEENRYDVAETEYNARNCEEEIGGGPPSFPPADSFPPR